jgi:lipopolysaccharide/colanic/teichoic acid biosynthesis glycosyltransferase/glycosyltransferase involved in cell wall biosynthesis
MVWAVCKISIMISVIIPVCNGAATIGGCIQALQQQTLPRLCYEIIVIDHGSSDETPRLAQEAGATVICRPGSAAGARNAGVGAAAGAIVSFTDATCAPAPDWLAQITSPFQEANVIGCKGVYGNKRPGVMARFVQLEYEEKYSRLSRQKQIDFIDTYSAAYRRDVLLANGGFDERFLWLEDQELSFRLAARGYRLIFQPAAVVYDHQRATLRGYFCKKRAIGYWKAQVVRRFPGQGISDSHTPQVLKLQMLLLKLFLLAAALALFTTKARPAALALPLAFLVTTLPFVRTAWPQDKRVALAAPLLLAVRAAALSLGYGWGLLRLEPGISGAQVTIGGANYVCKRGLDMAGALVGLFLTLLAGPWIALAIKLDSPGPVLFRQERIGQGGRPFTLYKFRSMTANAEAELPRLLVVEDLVEPAFKLEKDSRVTVVGRFLRRWSLDELPQFWNVLKGDMSLVGPRPEESRLVAAYNDWHRRRLAVKPGMSGPMQINGRGDLSLDARVRLEVAYIEKFSLWRDLVILIYTIPTVLRGKGAR